MVKSDVDMLKAMVREYGAVGMTSGLIIALRGVRDEASDMGLKTQAKELDEIVWMLEDILYAPDLEDKDPFDD